MEKVVKDGMVAVIVTSSFGGGWSTWHDGSKKEKEIMLFHPKLVNLVLQEKGNEIDSDLMKSIGVDNHGGGWNGLEIEWVPEGSHFFIHEYDGAESVKFVDNVSFTA